MKSIGSRRCSDRTLGWRPPCFHARCFPVGSGEAAWFEAEVLRYDDATRLHLVRYTEDAVECEELLSGPKAKQDGAPELAVWRPCIKTTSRGAAAKAAMNAAAKAAAGLAGTD